MARGGRPALGASEIEERRSQILQAVLEQIGRRGAAGVRMKDVARSAGVSVGTIQYYFDSREELVLAAFTRHSDTVIAQVDGANRQRLPPWEALLQTLHDFLHVQSFHQRTRLWVEFVAASTRDEQLRSLLDRVFLAWRQVVHGVVEAGVEDGTFAPPVETDVVVEALLAQLDGFEIAHATGAHGTGIDRIEYVLRQSAAALLGLAEHSLPTSVTR